MKYYLFRFEFKGINYMNCMVVDNYIIEIINQADYEQYIEIRDIANNYIFIRKCDLQNIMWQELYNIQRIELKEI